MSIEVAAPASQVEAALEEHLGPRWRQTYRIVEQSANAPSVRRRGEVPWSDVLSTIETVGEIAGSGILGNAAYDGTKSLIAFMRKHFGKDRVTEAPVQTSKPMENTAPKEPPSA